MSFIVLLLISLLAFKSSYANSFAGFKSTDKTCKVTPALYDIMPLPKFHTSNNLRRLAGSSQLAVGQPMIVMGKVTDRNCVPISGAIVELWQKNAKGVYNFDIRYRDDWDENFSSTGTAIADNVGNFSFFTIFPGEFGGGIPHLNLRVRHRDFAILETRFFFEDQQNGVDKLLRSLNIESRKLVMAKRMNDYYHHSHYKGFLYYEVNLILDGDNKYTFY